MGAIVESFWSRSWGAACGLVHQHTWRGLAIASEDRCSPYNADEYRITGVDRKRARQQPGRDLQPSTRARPSARPRDPFRTGRLRQRKPPARPRLPNGDAGIATALLRSTGCLREVGRPAPRHEPRAPGPAFRAFRERRAARTPPCEIRPIMQLTHDVIFLDIQLSHACESLCVICTPSTGPVEHWLHLRMSNLIESRFGQASDGRLESLLGSSRPRGCLGGTRDQPSPLVAAGVKQSLSTEGRAESARVFDASRPSPASRRLASSCPTGCAHEVEAPVGAMMELATAPPRTGLRQE